MKVFRFGSKKRPDPRPEDEWLRKALLEAQREPVGLPSQDVTFALSGTASGHFRSANFCPLTENGRYLHFTFTNTGVEKAMVTVMKEGWFHRVSRPATMWVDVGETSEGTCELSNKAIYWIQIRSDMSSPVSGTLHAVQSDTE